MAESAVTLVADRSFMLIDEIVLDFNLFIEQEGQAFAGFFIDHGLLTPEDLKTIFEGIAGVMRWLYDRLTDFENLVIPLDAAFAMLEVVAGFFDGLIDMIEDLPESDSESPVSLIYNMAHKIDSMVPDNFNARELVERLNVLPATDEIIALKKSILKIIGTEGMQNNENIDGSLPALIRTLTNNP